MSAQPNSATNTTPSPNNKSSGMTNQAVSHYDEHWKHIIMQFFAPFIKRCLPKLFKQIDFSRGIDFLEQELHKITADLRKAGKRSNDKLVKVYLKNGAERWILIHIEVQKQYAKNFPERMFVYYYCKQKEWNCI